MAQAAALSVDDFIRELEGDVRAHPIHPELAQEDFRSRGAWSDLVAGRYWDPEVVWPRKDAS